jgi:SAM-dependent methyltransferase
VSKHKQVWEDFGAKDPYFAVATHDAYRTGNIERDSKIAFFESGREHVETLWPEFEASLGTEIRPRTTLDYGCGVGRILIPLAARSERAVAVDVSCSMLEAARSNCDRAGHSNVTFQGADEFMRNDGETYDLVHSYIVLQHIPPAEGCKIIDKLAGRLTNGGLGMIHITYRSKASFFKRFRFRLYRDVPGVHRFSNVLMRRDQPFMPMYEYDLDRVEQVLEANNCEIFSERDTDHGFLGKMLFFRKSGPTS